MSEVFDGAFGEQPAADETVTETVAEAAPNDQAPETPSRAPDGKFTAKAEAPAETPPADPLAPLGALLDEREKRQAATARAEAAERRLAEIEAARETSEPIPPELAVQQALHAQNMRASRRFAEREYGKDTIAAVHDWAEKRCGEDAVFNSQMMAHDDPYEAAYQAYNRAQLEPMLTGIKPDDLAAFKEWQAAQAAAPAPTPVQTPRAASAPIPRSLVNQPGTGSVGRDVVALEPGSGFAAAFS